MIPRRQLGPAAQALEVSALGLGCMGFEHEARQANRVFVEPLGRIAARKDATPAQVALAWLLAQKPWIVPIPGTTKLERLDENLRAATLQLTPEDLREIEQSALNLHARGARYPEAHERLVGR